MEQPAAPRRTPQQAALMDLLKTLPQFHTAQEIHTLLTERAPRSDWPPSTATSRRWLRTAQWTSSALDGNSPTGCAAPATTITFLPEMRQDRRGRPDGVEELLLTRPRPTGSQTSATSSSSTVCEFCHATR